VAVLLALATGCAALRPRELTPQELEALARREVEEPLPLWPVRLPGGALAQAEASAAPEVRSSGGEAEVEISISTDEPVTCRVLPGPIRAAAELRARIEEARHRVDYQAIEVVAVEPAGGAAVLFVEAVYTTKGGSSLGTLKLAAVPGERRAFLCEHDEVGYAKTFRRVVVQLVASARAQGEEQPAFWEALETRVEGRSVGLIVRQESGGDFTASEVTLLPIEGGKVRAVDVRETGKIGANAAGQQRVASVAIDGAEVSTAQQSASVMIELERRGPGGTPRVEARRIAVHGAPSPEAAQ
jgi:hypothetical protein